VVVGANSHGGLRCITELEDRVGPAIVREPANFGRAIRPALLVCRFQSLAVL
jgi:hypothetical protein